MNEQKSTSTYIDSNRKNIRAWAWYDWANSVYSLTITSAIFPVYYTAVTTTDSGSMVDFFGFTLENTVLYSWILSLSFLISAALTPILSGIADYGGRKKWFMQAFCYLGGFSSIALAGFTGPENLELGMTAFLLASLGFTGSLVFYNAFLPEICAPSEYDTVSARGYAMGYLGSMILLILNLLMIQKPDWFGLNPGTWPARISCITVGFWWIGFAQITFRGLPKEPQNRGFVPGILTKGFQELRHTWASLKNLPQLKIFLSGFFFYSMGIQTVMYMATLFGSKELKLETSDLILTVLLIQLVGIGGAYLFAWLAKMLGNPQAIVIALFIWMFICFAAWFTYTREEFFAIAIGVGLVMGGTQSLSRSTFARNLPATIDHASYFSLLDVTEKLAIVLGTASYGFFEVITGNMRNSIVLLMFFFLIGAAAMIGMIREQKRLKSR